MVCYSHFIVPKCIQSYILSRNICIKVNSIFKRAIFRGPARKFFGIGLIYIFRLRCISHWLFFRIGKCSCCYRRCVTITCHITECKESSILVVLIIIPCTTIKCDQCAIFISNCIKSLIFCRSKWRSLSTAILLSIPFLKYLTAPGTIPLIGPYNYCILRVIFKNLALVNRGSIVIKIGRIQP